nr:AI-2E family transporter [Microbacterium sp. Be9]
MSGRTPVGDSPSGVLRVGRVGFLRLFDQWLFPRGNDRCARGSPEQLDHDGEDEQSDGHPEHRSERDRSRRHEDEEREHQPDQKDRTVEAIDLDEEASDAAASVLDPTTLLGLARSIGGTVVSVATALFFVCAYIIFMAVDAARYRQAPAIFGATKGAVIARISRLNTGVRRYYIVNASFGAIVAIIDGLALWWMGVPAPVVWAILAFVTNFIPNIGFVLGLVPPAILAFVVGGWPLLLGVVAVYCIVNVVLQVLVQPKFVSDAVDLSLTLSFFSVIFWTFIIGPLGAILSIPLTLLARTLVFEGDPDATWLRWLSGDRTAVPAAPEPEPVEPARRRRRRRAPRRR